MNLCTISSSMLTKRRALPGSPWRARGRRAAGRSWRTRCIPSRSRAARPAPPRRRPSRMSVPRPAMLVAMVMAPALRPGRRSRLLAVAHRVQDAVREPERLEQGKRLAVADAARADQDRASSWCTGGPPRRSPATAPSDRRMPAAGARRGGRAGSRATARLELVDIPQLLRDLAGRAGHPGELVKETEEALEAEACQRLVGGVWGGPPWPR